MGAGMIYVGIVIFIVVLEYLIKGYIEKNKTEGSIEEKCGGFLRIRKYHNKGAFLNFLEKHGIVVKAVSVAFCILLTVMFVLTLGKKGSIALKTGLALLLGGAYSNTYDRLYRKYVVDYFSFHITKGPFRGLSRVVFNLADFCIMIGALIVVLALSE